MLKNTPSTALFLTSAVLWKVFIQPFASHTTLQELLSFLRLTLAAVSLLVDQHPRSPTTRKPALSRVVLAKSFISIIA
jgi:hypothetical protein